MEFYHSAKGTTWKNHKYIAIKNGRYIYPSKRQGASARKKVKQLVSNSPNIAKGFVNQHQWSEYVPEGRRPKAKKKTVPNQYASSYGSAGRMYTSTFTPSEFMARILRMDMEEAKKNAVSQNQVQKIINKVEKEDIDGETFQKAMRTGNDAINRILGTNFKLTGVIDMEGRGLKKDTKVTLEPTKYSEPKKRR